MPVSLLLLNEIVPFQMCMVDAICRGLDVCSCV